eukprot:c12977_g2_i2.p1 GENE.c12977_g2_i2~~c12977_g2_i2.p1  ORF type:complete len:747 (+),score=202.03 c12977_g2_i2:45-2243(+)
MTSRVSKKRKNETQAQADAPTPSAPDDDDALFHHGRVNCTHLQLEPDHDTRPMWVCSAQDTRNQRIFLETSGARYKKVCEFLILIAEPVCRLEHMHEYILTKQSLYAAASVGLDAETIVKVLASFSKNALTPEISKFIHDSTSSYGKVKIVLRQHKYTIQSTDLKAVEALLKVEKIRNSVCNDEGGPQMVVERQDTAETASVLADAGLSFSTTDVIDKNDDDIVAQQRNHHCFQIRSEFVRDVKQEAIDAGYPLLEEYDFRNDSYNKDLPMDLKPTTIIRPYQERALSKMFSNGRARSGIIVLPCGAGKTLVGITAACTVKKSTLVLCTSGVAVEQWKQQFLLWTTIDKARISTFTSDNKELFVTDTGVCVSTYTMIGFTGTRASEAQRVIDSMQKREWGLIILDEVHVVPAKIFRTVVHTFAVHCKLGLTATLVREDNLIRDLNFLIGPKLYEANWLDLQKQNFIATVMCAEVWCPMTKEFFEAYLASPAWRQRLLYTMNPNKYICCKFLINYHESKGDKVIVFSDNIKSLEWYAMKTKRLFIHGSTPQKERMVILTRFQNDPKTNCVFISKVGDNSIDLPGANVIIQISSHFGARRQEAQRLGRILRAKPRQDSRFNAFFYTLVSQDTRELYFSSKRQQFLIDQGYSFRVLTELTGLKFQTSNGTDNSDESQFARDALEMCLKAEEKLCGVEDDVIDEDTLRDESTAVRRQTNTAALTGAAGNRYVEARK